jgi:hypothetical protein
MTGDEPTAAIVMCTLCGAVGTAETDVDLPAGHVSALAWAAHFVTRHPDAPLPLGQHVVMLPDPTDRDAFGRRPQ